MSLISDAVAGVDARVESVSNVSLTTGDGEDEQKFSPAALGAESSPRIVELLRLVKALSQFPAVERDLQIARIEGLLVQSGLPRREFPRSQARGDDEDEDEDEDEEEQPQGQELAASQLENDVEWLLLGKAAVQVYGLVMQTLLDQIVPLSEDIWYWDDVLHSYPYSCLLTVQSSPLRMWAWTTDIYQESIDRFRELRQDLVEERTVEGGEEKGAELAMAKENTEVDEAETRVRTGTDAGSSTAVASSHKPSLSAAWGEFYSIVRESIAERYIGDLRRRVLSPVDVCRAEARKKREDLLRVKATTATGLGMLLAESFNFNSPTANAKDKTLGWKGVLERSVYLMDMLLENITAARHLEMSAFEERVFESVAADKDLAVFPFQLGTKRKTSQIATRLLGILRETYPYHVAELTTLRKENGRPSRLVRYWLPAITLLASSSTLLRILVRRKHDIITWIRELGATTRDFYLNWVVEPVRKIIATIRHDNNSEIALMSRDSLKADRESLERMVVDFAMDKPDIAVGASTISESQIADIRAKVREGDVTPILRAYEKDLRQPFVGAIKGDLVRALLVQIQKTKVDLEVAISGIDSLLQSQELVFGFVGLTPGVLVSLALFRYLGTILGGRWGLRRSYKARRRVRVLRNIHRILSDATPRVENQNHISYKDHGLLVYEVHVLRNLAKGMLPSDIEKEFFQDLGDLANLKSLEAQTRTGDRIRWAYRELWR